MLASDINDLVMMAEANMLEAMNQTTNIQMLEDEFAKQQILFDFYFQNTSQVTIDNALWQPDNSCIMVDMNNYIEFFLSAVTTLVPTMPVDESDQVTEIRLLRENTVVARALYTQDDQSQLNRNFSLFYKG